MIGNNEGRVLDGVVVVVGDADSSRKSGERLASWMVEGA